MSDDRLAVNPGPDSWDEPRAELARTGVASVEAFDRDELPWIPDRFALYRSNLEPVVEDFPQRRFAQFLSLTGYRFLIDGWQHANNRIELVDIEIATSNHPEIQPN